MHTATTTVNAMGTAVRQPTPVPDPTHATVERLALHIGQLVARELPPRLTRLLEAAAGLQSRLAAWEVGPLTRRLDLFDEAVQALDLSALQRRGWRHGGAKQAAERQRLAQALAQLGEGAQAVQGETGELTAAKGPLFAACRREAVHVQWERQELAHALDPLRQGLQALWRDLRRRRPSPGDAISVDLARHLLATADAGTERLLDLEQAVQGLQDLDGELAALAQRREQLLALLSTELLPQAQVVRRKLTNLARLGAGAATNALEDATDQLQLLRSLAQQARRATGAAQAHQGRLAQVLEQAHERIEALRH